MYVVRPPDRFSRWHEVGYYKPDGEWERHTGGLGSAAADELVNQLNGGSAAVSQEYLDRLEQMDRERRRDDAEERRAREAAELQREQERRAAAEQEAANIAERARLEEASNARWLETEQENRRRAEAERAEQLRMYPPRELRGVGGLADWNGIVAFRLKAGGSVDVPVDDIV